MKPSMGRVVHYVDGSGEAFPAMIRVTFEQDPDRVDLTAFTQYGTREVAGVRRDDLDHANDTWHWPERVE